MYSFSEMEAGEKSNRSFTYANPCLCCCPTIEFSTRFTALFDILVHVILYFVAADRLSKIPAAADVFLAYKISVILCIVTDVLIVMGTSALMTRGRFLVVIYTWWVVHLILLILWFAVLWYYIPTYMFGRSPYRNFETTNISAIIPLYAVGEIFVLFVYYAWAFFVMVAFAHFVKNVKVYPERTPSVPELAAKIEEYVDDDGIESNRPPCADDE